MTNAFISLLNMSLAASYAAFAVMLVRFFLKRTPKVFSYILWAIVLFRLICPYSLDSSFSLFPSKIETIPRDFDHTYSPNITRGIVAIGNRINDSIQSPLPTVDAENSVYPAGTLMDIGAVIWILGLMIILTHGAVSYIRLKGRLTTATLVYRNIYETDRIKYPFVLGFIKPRIYLPLGLPEDELGYIIAHEETHIRRYDHIIKPVAYLAIVLHWFNPILWISYFLMVKDMEMSCDESVIKHSSKDIRKYYSSSLLSLSLRQNGLISPLAFGESNVKSRIKNVLNYKKPAFWVVIIAVLAVTITFIGLATNPKERQNPGAVISDYKPAIMADGMIYWLSPSGNVKSIPDECIIIGQIKKVSPPVAWPEEEFEAIGFSEEFLGSDIFQNARKDTIYILSRKNNQYIPLVSEGLKDSGTEIEDEFHPYIRVYELTMRKAVRLPLDDDMILSIENAIEHPNEEIFIEDASGRNDGFHETDIYIQMEPEWDEEGSYNGGYAILHNADKDIKVLVPPYFSIGEGNTVPLATGVCDEIMDRVEREMGWRYTTIKEIYDIEKAQIIFDGEVLSEIDDRDKIKQLEGILTGAKQTYIPNTYFFGPKLILTRKDGRAIPIDLDIQDDLMCLEPWFFYKYGSAADRQPRLFELLRIFGLSRWPNKVYESLGMEPPIN